MSNRLTFSLASLIVLIAFGLVFVATPAMAHLTAENVYDPLLHDGLDTDGKTALTGTAYDAEVDHTHRAAPTVTKIELVDVKIGANKAAREKADAESTVKDTSVVLVNDAAFGDTDPVTKTDLGGTTAGEFRIKITFSEAVYLPAQAISSAEVDPAAADGDLAATSILDSAASKAASTQKIEDLTVAEVARDGKAFTTFLATVTVPGDNLSDVPMDVWISVARNAVFSKGKFKAGDDLHGQGNAASSRYQFTVVKTLPTVTEMDAPTVMIEPPTELNAMDKAVFKLTFSEVLGNAANDLQFGDIDIDGGSATADDLTKSDDGLIYTLNVTPDDVDNPSIVVTLNADSVADVNGNFIDLTSTPAIMEASTGVFDETAPTVMITAPMEPEADGKLKFTFTFSEEIMKFTTDHIDRAGSGNELLGPDSDPMQDDMDPTVWTVLVTPENPAMPTSILILKGSVMDKGGNGLAGDERATYTPPGAESTDPTVEIAITGDSLNCEVGNLLTITPKDDVGIAAGEAVVMSEVSASAGWKITAGTAEGSIMVVPNEDGSEIGVTSVTVTVAANAVKDAAGNGNAATSKTFTVGPVLTIPARGFITVIRPEHRGRTHLGDPLIVGSLGVRGGVVNIQTWECMPDLHNFYRRTPPGIGGGALVVKESAANNSTTNPVAKGTVGISEVMWAIDLGETFGGLPASGLSNLDHTREQWIELHNLNGHPVKVTLFARPTNTALTAEADEIDRVSNFNVRNAWDVKGQNGDSARGVDFISMQRGTATTAKNYAHGDFNGNNAGKWSASGFTYLTRVPELVKLGQQLPEANRLYDFKGTPGRSNNVTATGAPVATSIPLKPFVINEVSNRDNRLYEWIEIRNSSDGEANLRNYLISIVEDVDNEYALYTFPNVDIKVPANGLVLVVASDPEDDAEHPLMVGHDIRGGNDQASGVNDNSPRYIVAGSSEKLHTEGLPDDGEFVMFLRRPEAAGKTNAASKLKTHDWVIDIAGYHPNLAKTGTYTSLWPLKAFPAPGLTHNKIAVNEVHFRRHADIDGTKTKDGNKHDKTALGNTGYTGIGYRRHATNSAVNGGTPGYHDIRKAQVGQLAGGIVTISEIMFDRGDFDREGRASYPQWIELYNSSATEAVNLHADDGWRLEIQNYDDGEIPIDMISGTLNFKSSEVQTLLPQQTVLIASTRARNAGSSSVNAGVVFISTRVFSVWADARGALGMSRSTDPILSEEAFYLRLIDGKGNLSDQAGNLTRRRVRGADAYWNWSEVQGEAEMDARSSVIRRYRAPEEGIRSERWDRYSNSEIKDMGIEADGWVSASETDFRRVETTWYGHEDDISTPAVTTGRALPVRLSKFRPERLETGEVVVRWITESELNNAGFNILRSETRDGAFTKLNTQLVKGHGTTSERNTYEFTDTSAKPNVVYYYQIQDVSFDGDVTTLQTTHLRGNVSAAGKLTTTWGELKALQ